MRILLVEDDPLTRCAIAAGLGAAGFTVVEAGHAQDALALFESAPESFSALVTDFELPGMQGSALAAHVRGLAPHLPVVIASGHPEALDSSREPALDFHVLRKPYSADALLVMLDVAGVTRG